MSLPRPLAFLPDADFLRLKDAVIARTGHFYYQDKEALLWERLARRLRATGLPGPGAYLARLAEPERGAAEWAALEAEITIGETFFFRYAEQFAALEGTILPEILARRGAERRLRAWSAGCASGAEPYSLAILLRRLLGDGLPDWRLSLLGTDLNEAALVAARAGRFSRWALRGLPAEELARDFTAEPDGRSWLLRPQHRALVRFERQNLLSLLAPDAPLELGGFDLILCRNVLIYFHPEVVQRLVAALAARLAEGGWLLLGHAEPNPAFARILEVVNLPGTVAYRRPGKVEGALPPQTPLSFPWAGDGVPCTRHQGEPTNGFPKASGLWWGEFERGEAPLKSAAPLSQQPPPLEAAATATPRALADAGDLAAALAACREGLRQAPTDPALHYYEGLVRRGLGQGEEAAAAFRRALYLRGDFVMAQYQLGLLLLDGGAVGPGRRALAGALRLARLLPPGAALPEGDGITAAALAEAARLSLDLPPPVSPLGGR
ncbi:protein-glutamate O-methyltransferase CheR [Roseomonas sp. GC11]|uniref:CheR family methyltransferase n=1 Tax=Roseomonas sp. GC11 TaxID=2950546 RepID=UPI00210BDCAF|nr:protein-glutamate O-methyltransferase CheR [Roseomonas sp. GC11]MCQ4162627.1 protein-glutamate O-methyltransferase CheR [Roseomonas sp. GC11]